MPLAALRGLVVLAFVVPVSLGVLARSADANSFDAALRGASIAVVKTVDSTIASAAWVLSYPSEQTAATSDSGVWDWFMSLFGGGEETQAILVEDIPVLPETPVPTSLPATPASAPRSLPPVSTSRLPERVIERTVVQPTYTTVVLPDPALEKRVRDLEQRPISSGGVAIAIPVFNHEEGNDNTFTGSAINTPTINGGTIVNLSGLSAADATITAATTTSLYATLARFAEGVITSLSATVANITTLVATSATLGNATSTNATTTNLYVSGQTTIGALSGFLKATAGVVSTALVNLASDVTGILPVSSGGTGWSAIASGHIPFGNGSSALATSSGLFFETGTGELGVGTANPGAKLDVVSGTQAIGIATGTNTSGYRLDIGANDDGVNFTNNSASRGYSFKNSNGTLVTINSGGTVGIGTTTFMNTAGVYADGNGFFAGGSEDPGGSNPSPGTFIGFNRSGGYGFIQAKRTGIASYNLILNPAAGGGNVGVGTTTPWRKLSVEESSTGAHLVLKGAGTGFENAALTLVATEGTDNRGLGTYAFDQGSTRVWYWGRPYSGSDAFAINRRATAGWSTDAADEADADVGNLFYINSSGNVGIGTVNPASRLDVALNQAKSATSEATYSYLGRTNESTNYAALRTYVVGAASASNRYWGFQTIEQGVANSGSIVFQQYGGSVGLGDTSPDFKLDVYGTICQDTDSNDTCDGTVSSDVRLKQDISTIDGALDLVQALRGVRFSWRQDLYPSNHFGTSTQVGFIAQEVEQVIPEVVGEDGDGYLWIDYQKLTAVLANAIQEVAAVSGAFRDNLANWLADTGNGIASVVAGTLKAKDLLCVGNTCITEAELINLLEQSNQVPVPPMPTPEPPAEEPPTEEPAPEGGEPPVENPEAL